MKKLVCFINLFDICQNIYYLNSETQENKHIGISSMEDLPKVIEVLCNKYEVDEVQLKGDNREFALKLSDDISNYLKINYNKNDIKVEVI